VAAGCHLETDSPGKSYAILEARDSLGGTWDLFRYPGIRSDSDMFTLGYRLRPWKEARAIADGPSILEYVRETAQEFGVDRHIRTAHRVVRAEWSTDEARWHVEGERTDTGESFELTCGFLFACTGYYRYDEGYTPEFPNVERFGGTLIHPQHWPEDLDYTGKRVLVIGSGATAVTLVPAMAERAAHVTMLQRTPSYIVSLPGIDPIAERVLRVFPERIAHRLLRWKNVLLQLGFFQLSRRRPHVAKRLIRHGVERKLPPGFDVDTHFSPPYNPWDQRICLVPDNDLFEAIAAGKASVVTDTVATFTEKGVELGSGGELEADIVVTATGLNLVALGGMQLAVDGEEVNLPETVTYKGAMLGGVPNLATALGYSNASWTLKADLICEYVCRLLNHMDAHGYVQATPRPPADALARRDPFLDLSSGYVLRAIEKFPKQGIALPWRANQNYIRDVRMFRRGDVNDGMEFRRAGDAATSTARMRVAA
jgi:monooxygenase